MSQASNKRILLKDNVFEAALKRIRWIFDEFENVIASISGGKDSTVIFYLTLMVAREKNRLPLKVCFLDQESEWLATIDNIKEIMQMPEVDPMWLQIPFKINNATSSKTDWMHIWDESIPDQWVRPKDPLARQENYLSTSDLEWYDMFHKIIDYEFNGEKSCFIAGVRAEESPRRASALTGHETYKGVTWGKVLNKTKQHYTFYPIYDWSYTDVWKSILDNNWSYNTIYDKMYQYGVKIHEMRVSSLHHESSVKSLFFLQEFEKENYNRMVARLNGVNTAAKMSYDDFYCSKELPFMFKDWLEYRDYLLEKLIEDENHKKKFEQKFKEMDPLYLPFYGEALYRKQINSILTNDFGFWKLNSIVIPTDRWEEFKQHRDHLKQMKKQDSPSL